MQLLGVRLSVCLSVPSVTRCCAGCNAVLAVASKSSTDKLQRVPNAAARVVSDTRKYDRRLSRLLHDELHWLDVPQPVQYKLCATVHRRLQHKAPHTVHDGLLHPHLRHCSSPASAGWQVTPHHSTRRTSASTPQTLLVASICGPPAAISCSYRDTGVPCSVIGPLL